MEHDADNERHTAAMPKRTLAQFVGCLLGGAVGDALGAPLDALSLVEIRALCGSNGALTYRPVFDRSGSITSCTQLTLFTAEGFLRADNRYRDRGICNPYPVIARAYLRWLVTQGEAYPERIADLLVEDGWLLTNHALHARRYPSSTCLAALRGATSARIAEGPLWADPINHSRGSAAVSRIAPIGLCAANPFKSGCNVAAMTHGHPTGYLAAGFWSALISFLINGVPLDQAIEHGSAKLTAYPHHRRCKQAIGRAVGLAADVQAGSAAATAEAVESFGRGLNADTAVAIALFCALVADSFEHGLALAVQHGGASTRTGTLAGQLLGLRFEQSTWPAHLLDELELRTEIEQVATDMSRHFGSAAEDYQGMQDWGRYPTY